MRWGLFLTLVAQVLIGTAVLALAAVVLAVVVRSARGDRR